MKKSINKNKMMNIGYILIFCVLSGYILNYLNLAAGSIPLMDYWIAGGANLEIIMTKGLVWSEVFPIPHALHWNPVYKVLNYVFVRFFYCDNLAYVFAGAFFLSITIAVILVIYHKKIATKSSLLTFCGAIVCVIPMINLNQWEILTLYCSVVFMLRILLYVLLLNYLDKLFVEGNEEGQWRRVIVYGIFSIVTILFVSQAYFPGFVAAVCFIVVVDYIIKRNKEYIKYYSAVFISMLSGALIYYVTLDKGTAGTGESVDISQRIIDFIKGLILMLGSTIIPQTKQSLNMQNTYSAGIVILSLACFSVYLFFRTKMYKKTYFPLACLVYAFVSILVIEYGRIYTFGLGSVTSSRYVVETTIGLVGLMQIYWNCLISIDMKKIVKGISVCAIVGVLGMMMWSNSVEMEIAPYRKIYNQGMENLLINIDEVTDEQLSIFQTAPDNVRKTAEIMKKYNLSVWHNSN